MGSHDVTALVKQSIRLRGDMRADPEMYTYGPTVCLKCKHPTTPDGQEVDGSALATVKGLVFRVKLPCAKCGSNVACLDILQEDTAA